MSEAIVSPAPSREVCPKVREYYDETGWDYDFIWLARRHQALHFGYYDAIATTHAAALSNTNLTLAKRGRVVAGSRVLDAGCGIGGSSIWLAQSCGALVVGITPVLTQVRQARRNAAASGVGEQAQFIVADYTASPFSDGTFDVVVALESLCHAPDKARFYSEVARLLRPSGRLVVAEYMRTPNVLDRGGERLMSEWLEGWAMPNLATPDEHVHFARSAGFASVELEDFTAKVRPSLRRLYLLARLCQPFAMTARGLRWRSATQHGNFVAAIRQYQALERSFWRYCLITAAMPAG